MTRLEQMEERFEAEGSIDLTDMRLLFAAVRSALAVCRDAQDHDNRNAPIGLEQVRVPTDVWTRFHTAHRLLEKQGRGR